MHTPGYFVVDTGDDWDGATVRDQYGRIVADCSGCDIPGTTGEVSVHEAKSNARLFAAAPELLEALEAAMELGAYRGDRMPIRAVKPIFDVMKAAIAKAKGETP